jgi:hypothetical protein
MSEIRLVQKNTLSPQSKERLLVKTNAFGVSLYLTNRSQTTDINGRIICGQTIDLAFGKNKRFVHEQIKLYFKGNKLFLDFLYEFRIRN